MPPYQIDTRFLDRKWRRHYRKHEDKLVKCYETVLTAISDPEILNYEPTIYLVNFFFRLETWKQGKGVFHIGWIINGPDPDTNSREAIIIPVQTIRRLRKNDLMATLAHEIHEILGKTIEGRLDEKTLKEAKEIVHQRKYYYLFNEPIKSLLSNWDKTPIRVKSHRVKLSETPTKTFRSSNEIKNWLKTSSHSRDQ